MQQSTYISLILLLLLNGLYGAAQEEQPPTQAAKRTDIFSLTVQNELAINERTTGNDSALETIKGPLRVILKLQTTFNNKALACFVLNSFIDHFTKQFSTFDKKDTINFNGTINYVIQEAYEEMSKKLALRDTEFSPSVVKSFEMEISCFKSKNRRFNYMLCPYETSPVKIFTVSSSRSNNYSKILPEEVTITQEHNW